MAFWVTETSEGFAMGEAADETEARLMIESQRRGSVTFNEATGRYRWTVVLDSGKTSHGYAETERDAWWHVKEALNRPYRGVRYRGPRGLFSLPPS
ncbi:hypothetical protein [Pseudonocardia sp. MH-G8]|uniref:hypothetical protein n=1 Tax=Pseudonocardia sp. MH-G8 TaxID=1854588 RepID=UPI000BA11DDB|nr:hypothetical protein [Pseudonocardia sp. MH-G8]OZM79418.1 hypothetical protein CFP66_24880 [Pseudonocardia sp. MH-G8]